MRPYSRPLLKSSRVKHFVAGAGVVLLLVALTAASTVGIAPMDESKGIMALTIDVQDIPCDEPYDPDERVVVDPDTVNGQIRMHVVVRNRDCCCCGTDGRGDLGLLRRGRSGVAPTRQSTTPDSPGAPTEVLSSLEESAEGPSPMVPTTGRGLAPLASTPSAPALGQPTSPALVTSNTSRVPWWIGLAAAPALLLFGRDSGDACEDDETGANSGPSRTC